MSRNEQRATLRMARDDFAQETERGHSTHVAAYWLVLEDRLNWGDRSAVITALRLSMLEGGEPPEWVRAASAEALGDFISGRAASLDEAFGVDGKAKDRRGAVIEELLNAADVSGKGIGPQFTKRAGEQIGQTDRNVRNMVEGIEKRREQSNSSGFDLQNLWSPRAPTADGK